MSFNIDAVDQQRQEDENENGKWVKFEINKSKKLMFLPKEPKSGNTTTKFGESYQITFFVADLSTKLQKEKEFQILGKKLQKMVINGIKLSRAENSKCVPDILEITKLDNHGNWKVDTVEQKK